MQLGSWRATCARMYAALALCALGACDDGPVASDDAGRDAGEVVDAHTPPADSGADASRDVDAPVVTSTLPRAGEALVAGSREVEIRWSEAMSPEDGTVTAHVGDVAVALDTPTWTAERDVLRIAPSARWPSESRVVVRVDAFRDDAGNAQAEPFELVFETTDEGPPSLVTSSPAEGETTVEPAIDSLVLRFSEPMNPHLGTLVLSGGPGVLGSRSWPAGDELRVDVEGLAAGASYRIALEGFADREGNPLDGTPVLGDGAIDFSTRPDSTAPRVVDSSPTNGQLDLDVVALETIAIQFDEPMDVTRRTAALTIDDAPAPVELTGNWSEDGTTLTFVATGRTRADAEHRLDLSALTDVAGNALEADVQLTDGALVFTTSTADEAVPFLVFASPAEGATGVPTRTRTIELLFSEAMDTSRTSVALATSASTTTLSGTWNAAGTRLVLAVPDGIAARTAHTIDLGGFTDASGNALDASHPYLGDGVLDFTTGAPTGEDCADPLTTESAARDGDAYVWTIAAEAFDEADGAPTCGVTPTSNHLDGVIEIVKTTPDVASGGSALRIEVVSATSINGIQFEVLRGACDPALAVGATGTREICAPSRLRSVQYLDVPAGTYYLWLAERRGRYTEGSTPPMTYQAQFPGATVRVEEVAALPDGESCSAPFTTASSNHTAPGADEHRWTIAFDGVRSTEYGASWLAADSLSCVSSQGADGVIRVEKARETSFLDVTVEPFPREGGGVYVEARTDCEARGAETALECTRRISLRERFQVQAPAGPVHLWLTSDVATGSNASPFPRVTVSTREVDPAPGETCASAIEIAPDATVPITPSTTTAYFAPSCFGSAPVTYYRYRTTRELDVVGTLGAGTIALVDRASGAELGCWGDASQVGMPWRAPAGTELCVAVPSGSAITALTIRELDWQGVDGAATVLPVTRPEGLSITSEAWLALSSTQLYLGINPNATTNAGIVTTPRTGDVATFVPVDRYSFGNAAVTIGEALFSVDETNATARPSRLFRLVSPAGALETPAGTVWDSGSSYGAVDIDALARVAGTDTLIMANDGTATTPTSFFTASATTPGSAVRIAQNSQLRDVTAIAASADWVFVIGSTALGRAVYRLPRATLATAAPEPLTAPDELSFNTTNGSMAYDPVRDIVYVRENSSLAGVHAIFDASTAAPVYAGAVVVRGRSTDHGLAIDPSVPALFLFETSTDPQGAFVELR